NRELPLYEYRCRQCATHVEKIQKFSDKPLRTCEKCGGELERLVSAPAIQFKGTGWYVTDYARKPSPESSSTSASGKKGDGTSASSASTPDSKPAGSSASKDKK
ncbi:MAG TPA: FmdB family zinc ribbon protein, partial [Terriglobia bacterium]|nr:FmdB family zinc ribbon protein [Terriglobia bacterium]